VAGAAAAVATWALLIEPRRLVVNRVRIESGRWPASRGALRIAVLSDLHAGGPHVDPERVARIVARVNREEPDLALLLGDFVDREVKGAEEPDPAAVARALGGLRAALGRVAVLGNHDWRYGGRRVAAALHAARIGVLENEALRLETPDGALWLAGVADPNERDAYVSASLAAVPEDEPVICLSHDPDLFPRVPARVALTVSGHLHGGQVGIPLVRRPVLPSRHGERYAHGHIVEHGRHLFVTRGVGEAGWPFRLAAPPEVALIELTAA
jgi:predicted MPP superfamily phosphohydrolase